MKMRICLRPLTAGVGAAMWGYCALAEQPPVVLAPAPVAAVVSAPAPSPDLATPAQVSANVAEVLKLARAQVNDDVIVAFVGNSKSTYSLGANDIVYLRQQGMSDRVISAMLDHHVQVAEVRPVSAPAVQSSSPAPAPAPKTATTYVAPAYVAAPPAYVYPAPAYPYYDPYPRSYWGFPWPAISLGFGFDFGHGHGHGHHH